MEKFNAPKFENFENQNARPQITKFTVCKIKVLKINLLHKT